MKNIVVRSFSSRRSPTAQWWKSRLRIPARENPIKWLKAIRRSSAGMSLIVCRLRRPSDNVTKPVRLNKSFVYRESLPMINRQTPERFLYYWTIPHTPERLPCFWPRNRSGVYFLHKTTTQKRVYKALKTILLNDSKVPNPLSAKLLTKRKEP